MLQSDQEMEPLFLVNSHVVGAGCAFLHFLSGVWDGLVPNAVIAAAS